MTNASNPYLTVKAVAKKRLATPIALVCAFFGVAVAYSTVELFLRGETGSGVISCFLFAAVMTPVYRIFRHAYRKLSARRIAEALIPLSEESLTFNQLQTVLSSEKAIQQIKTLIGNLFELRREESRSKGRRAALQILRPADDKMTARLKPPCRPKERKCYLEKNDRPAAGAPASGPCLCPG